MVMADQESPSTDLKQDKGVPLDEVLGEAEARFGPMPTCLRSILLPPLPPTSHPLVSTTVSFDTSNSHPESNSTLNINGGLSPCEKDRTGQTGVGDQTVGISIDDIALVSSSPSSLKNSNSVSHHDDHTESRTKSGTIFRELDDDYDENVRRSPDSGCSMSEASAEDKLSIASTVSASSDDGSISRLGCQIQRLRQAMRELREQDVALARQLLIIYDYVEETKWFLENFEACDPRHSITGPMTSTERRFSQNFQKRMSDFGIKGIPHSGFATPPSWTELNGNTAKRHSRNISDGMISIEHLRRIYHENNNNAVVVNTDGVDKSESCEAIPDGLFLDRSAIKNKSPRSMTRRSISSNFLEISFNSMTSKVDHGRHQAPLSPISDSGKTVTMHEDGDVDNDDDMHLHSTPLSLTKSIDRTGQDTTSVDEERTSIAEAISFSVQQEKQALKHPHLTSDHHRGSASSSSASSMISLQSFSSTSSTSASSTDICTRSNASQNTAKVMMNIPPLSSNTSSLNPTADDCSIFIADDSDDCITEDNGPLMSPFESHMTWLQEQDETLL